jgi:hypothetical protein
MTERESDFFQLELRLLAEQLNTTVRFRFGAGALLFTINFVMLAVAFCLQQRVILLCAIGIMLILVSMDFALSRILLGYYYRANRILVEKLGISEDNIFDMAVNFLTLAKMKKIQSLMSIAEDGSRYKAMRLLPLTIPTLQGFFAPFLAISVETALFILSKDWSGWHF